MKPDIHPAYMVTEVTCSCGNTFTTRSTASNGVIHVETCNVCHPFYTGKQRVLDTAGRVAKFQQKYARAKAAKAAGSAEKSTAAAKKTAAKKTAAKKATATKATATKATATKATATKATKATKAAEK